MRSLPSRWQPPRWARCGVLSCSCGLKRCVLAAACAEASAEPLASVPLGHVCDCIGRRRQSSCGVAEGAAADGQHQQQRRGRLLAVRAVASHTCSVAACEGLSSAVAYHACTRVPAAAGLQSQAAVHWGDSGSQGKRSICRGVESSTLECHWRVLSTALEPPAPLVRS